jgi:hypothetical protein
VNSAKPEPLRCTCSEQGLHRYADEASRVFKLRVTCEDVSEMLTRIMLKQAKAQREAH